MSKICLFGASGHGKVVRDIALSTGEIVVAFFDDAFKKGMFYGVPIVSLQKIHDYNNNLFVISIGNNAIRKKISKKLKVSYATIFHKTATISETVTIGKGTVIMGRASVNADAIIGKHSIINTGAVIEHDCRIGDYVHVSPHATITGNVIIGESSHVGAGAIIIPNICIGKGVTIGAGAVVINDVPDHAVVVGNPGKIIKYNDQ